MSRTIRTSDLRSPPAALDDLFSDKARVFWLLQIGGWAAYALLRLFQGLINGMGWAIIGPTLVATATGFSLTLIMAAVYRRIIHRRSLTVWAVTAPLVIVAAAAFSALEVWGHATFYSPQWEPRGIQFFGLVFVDLFVLTAWTGLYFGINYYLILRQQTERILKITAQAHEAQLKMLRYQLNPHFLFNTLNSISTLVLLKDTGRANAMLGRLSAFLRYTLQGEPAQTVTVAQEVEALRLYLEIEQMRFEDRLRTEFHIDAAAANALIPSLLLQPLVENAIKYAVAPQEEGATLTLDAGVQNGSLVLRLSDTGPGFRDLALAPPGAASLQPASTGVGLANIRDRLAQVYGPDHEFSVSQNVPQGAVITIRVPHQSRAPAKRPTVPAAA
jgi:two-component system, LytTR family, sensor kinase